MERLHFAVNKIFLAGMAAARRHIQTLNQQLHCNLQRGILIQHVAICGETDLECLHKPLESR